MATQRDAQREATRARILAAAQASLLEHGYAATSTLAVQERAGVSRGALLHHFPTRALLFGALVEHLVADNEQAVRSALSAGASQVGADPLRSGLQVLYDALRRPAFQAELELWAAARTDPELGSALRDAERRARGDLHRVLDEVLGRTSADDTAAALTVTLLRGLVAALPLREDPSHDLRLLDAWAEILGATDRTSPGRTASTPVRRNEGADP